VRRWHPARRGVPTPGKAAVASAASSSSSSRAPVAASGAAGMGSRVGGRAVPDIGREEEVEGVEERAVASVASSAGSGRADQAPPPRVWAVASPSTHLALRAPSGGAWVRWVAGSGPGGTPPTGIAAATGEAAQGNQGAGAGSGAEEREQGAR
jgi:hypothetical protein